ncbi:MAG: inositol monophosphatase [Deltaproteobacteria bacterium]|nr:inositol monophosphatase [Deltaproteobacteria bacterium]MBW1922473.1 inositol monophosphatase [Deltaproteobacteria bacterium]MBW1948342.1 inositol monophosphatase [Deltaproteobacteria bacterium]MBW2006626.1 inositol monophosphatase [Deltaproteobacteria bacterium]MBW2101489.1 inositol monophosphatase [Deltaproteobacteria bacterium]
MWEREKEIAHEAARAAGAFLADRFGGRNTIMKKGLIDLVTDADLGSEEMILEIISSSFPADTILSEEAGARDQASGRTWIVDPLDGTTNFAHGFPFFAVSIALEEKGDLVLGLVFDPIGEECFEAVKGQGALLNGRPVRVSETDRMTDALLGTGFPYDVHEKPHRVMERFTRMITRAQGVRRPGSAALDLCYVASGRFDGFWEEKLKPWDTAGGALIVKEAGGVVTDFHGNPYSPFGRSILAANRPIHAEMLRILASRETGNDPPKPGPRASG